MKQEKELPPSKRYVRRIFLFGLLFILCLVIVPLYTHFFSPKQRLWRELTAYKKSIDAGQPRPDLVPHLTSNSIPYLLDWIETKDYPTSWKRSFARRLRPLSDSFASKLIEWDSSLYQHHPPTLAVLGFDFLGSQATAALPALRDLAVRSDAYDEAMMAIIAIGPKAFPIAIDFAQQPQPRIRRTGAHILGALRVNPTQSSAILLKLIDDPNQAVRRQAYNALAEFPSPHIETILLPRLASDDPEVLFDVAYALHSGSTNALLHILSVARDSTNRPILIAVLAALASRDDLQRIESLNKPRNSVYQIKHLGFNHQALSTAARVFDAPDNRDYDSIRSNIIRTGFPQVGKTLGPPKRPLTTSSLPEN